MHYDIAVRKSLFRPAAIVIGVLGVFLLSLGLYPLLGLSFFLRTDPSQFVINAKTPSGTRIEPADEYVAHIEQDIRNVIPGKDLGMIVSNIGTTPGFSAIYSSNSGPHTAFIQVSLNKGHSKSSFAYMSLGRSKLRQVLPEISTYFQTGGLVDVVVNPGLPAPIDIQVSGNNLKEASAAVVLAKKIRALDGVGDVLIPQDGDYPGLNLQVNREMAGRLGLSSREVVNNVMTALTSNAMIAPNSWDDPKSGNSYLIAVQYPESQMKSLQDLSQIPIRSHNGEIATNLGAVVQILPMKSPTEVDHYQLQRVNDIYVSPSGQDLCGLARRVAHVISSTPLQAGALKIRRILYATDCKPDVTYAGRLPLLLQKHSTQTLTF